jgi:hypothetical protein
MKVGHIYRRESKHQAWITRQTTARATKKRKWLSAVHHDYPPDFHDLRRVIEVADYDLDTPTTHFI